MRTVGDPVSISTSKFRSGNSSSMPLSAASMKTKFVPTTVDDGFPSMPMVEYLGIEPPPDPLPQDAPPKPSRANAQVRASFIARLSDQCAAKAIDAGHVATRVDPIPASKSCASVRAHNTSNQRGGNHR